MSALAVSSQFYKGFETLAEAAPGHVAHARSLIIDVLSQEQLRRLGRDADRIMSRIDTPAINEHYTSIPVERSADDRVDHLYGSPSGIHGIFLCARSWFGPVTPTTVLRTFRRCASRTRVGSRAAV